MLVRKIEYSSVVVKVKGWPLHSGCLGIRAVGGVSHLWRMRSSAPVIRLPGE